MKLGLPPRLGQTGASHQEVVRDIPQPSGGLLVLKLLGLDSTNGSRYPGCIPGWNITDGVVRLETPLWGLQTPPTATPNSPAAAGDGVRWWVMYEP